MEESLLLNRQGKAKGKVPLGARPSIVSKSGCAYLCGSALSLLGQKRTFLADTESPVGIWACPWLLCLCVD